MEQVSLKIGERLKEIRNTRHLTLDEAAELTGVSKPMLGQIERGQSSPTINVLWKISTGLKIPLSFFCRQPETEYTVAGLSEKEMITEEDGGMRAYPLFPFDPARKCCCRKSSPYGLGQIFPIHTIMFQMKCVLFTT